MSINITIFGKRSTRIAGFRGGRLRSVFMYVRSWLEWSAYYYYRSGAVECLGAF